MRLFSLDSPVIRALSRMADLMLLNALTLICCIPIVTAGASFTAMHYMCLKMARNEETYIAKGFFKSFKQNFKQATIIWLIFLVLLVIFAGDLYILTAVEDLPTVLRAIIMVTMFVVLLTMTMVYPVLAKFDSTVGQTIKNAFLISIMQFPKTIIMFVLNWLPWILMLTFIQIAPLSVLFGFSAPAFASAYLYNGLFKKLEAQIEETQAENAPEQAEENDNDERIFHDELDTSLERNDNIQ